MSRPKGLLHLTRTKVIVPGEPVYVYDGWCLKAGQLKKKAPGKA